MDTTKKQTQTLVPQPPAYWSEQPRRVSLPAIPETASDVPWLTSIHATDDRGSYGQAGFRGNCSGVLIRDLLQYFRPTRVLDPMSGGGTCRDVCDELGIDSQSFDLASGFDAADPTRYADLGRFDFVWLHPPYWRMIRYGSDRRCLSNAPTLADFLQSLQTIIRNCVGVLSSAGHLAILIGDGKDQGDYLGLPFHTLALATAEGLWLAAPEIVRFSHGATSSGKRYHTRFIPRLHDLCFVLKRHPGTTTLTGLAA